MHLSAIGSGARLVTLTNPAASQGRGRSGLGRQFAVTAVPLRPIGVDRPAGRQMWLLATQGAPAASRDPNSSLGGESYAVGTTTCAMGWLRTTRCCGPSRLASKTSPPWELMEQTPHETPHKSATLRTNEKRESRARRAIARCVCQTRGRRACARNTCRQPFARREHRQSHGRRPVRL